MKSLKASTLFVLILFLFAGCQSGSKSPSEVVDSYHQAIWDEDVDAVMSYMIPGDSRDYVEQEVARRSQGMKRTGGLPPIVSETIDGDKAVVVCRFGPVELDVNLARHEGAWKIDTRR